jgi:hypothetical protein
MPTCGLKKYLASAVNRFHEVVTSGNGMKQSDTPAGQEEPVTDVFELSCWMRGPPWTKALSESM